MQGRMEHDYMDLDQEEILLESPVYCGTCMTAMDHLEKSTFKCPSCGTIYNYQTR